MLGLSAILAQLGTVPVALAAPVGLELTRHEILALEATGPRLWLTEIRDTAQPNSKANIVQQEVTERFCVLALVSGEPGAGPVDLAAAMEALLGAAEAVLLGFAPTPACGPVCRAQSAMVRSADARLYWLAEYLYIHHIRSPR